MMTGDGAVTGDRTERLRTGPLVLFDDRCYLYALRRALMATPERLVVARSHMTMGNKADLPAGCVVVQEGTHPLGGSPTAIAATLAACDPADRPPVLVVEPRFREGFVPWVIAGYTRRMREALDAFGLQDVLVVDEAEAIGRLTGMDHRPFFEPYEELEALRAESARRKQEQIDAYMATSWELPGMRFPGEAGKQGEDG